MRFSTIANQISSPEKHQLISAAINIRPRQELMTLQQFASLVKVLTPINN